MQDGIGFGSSSPNFPLRQVVLGPEFGFCSRDLGGRLGSRRRGKIYRDSSGFGAHASIMLRSKERIPVVGCLGVWAGLHRRGRSLGRGWG